MHAFSTLIIGCRGNSRYMLEVQTLPCTLIGLFFESLHDSFQDQASGDDEDGGELSLYARSIVR